MNHYERVCAYVDLSAIRANMEAMHQVISPDTKMIGVIKTDGYGHGAVPIAGELEKLPYLFGFATATAEEAMILRKSNINKPILILGYVFPYAYEEMVQNQIRLSVFKLDQAKALSETATKLGKKMMIHIKVDTAMSRIGIMPNDEGIAFIKEVMKLPGLEIEGIFTHFAKADYADLSDAKAQLATYRVFLERVQKECKIRIPLKHCSNSAGIIALPEANMDLVRAGITLYGLWPSDEVARDVIPLVPALSLKSHIVYIKQIEKGTQVSYGGTFTADAPMKIATIPVGYGDGYPRTLSGKGYVLIRGQKAPILGRVCMDQFMVDVTNIPDVAEYDEVTLIGTDGENTITAEELGALSGRFNYELSCDLGKRIPRVYVRDGEIVASKDYHNDVFYGFC